MLEELKVLIKKAMPDVDITNATEESRLFDDLGFDSLGLMLLAMQIQKEMGIEFDGELDFVTVGDVLKYIESKKKQSILNICPIQIYYLDYIDVILTKIN